MKGESDTLLMRFWEEEGFETIANIHPSLFTTASFYIAHRIC